MTSGFAGPFDLLWYHYVKLPNEGRFDYGLPDHHLFR